MYLLNNFGNSYMLRNGSLSQFPLVIRFLHTEIAQFKKSALELSLTHMLQFRENWSFESTTQFGTQKWILAFV